MKSSSKAFSLLIAVVVLVLLSLFGVSALRFANLNQHRVAHAAALAQAKIFTHTATQEAFFEFLKSAKTEFETYFPNRQNPLFKSSVKVQILHTASANESNSVFANSQNSTALQNATTPPNRIEAIRLVTTTNSLNQTPEIRIIKVTTKLP